MAAAKQNPVLLITGVTGYVGHHLLQFVNQTFTSYTAYATYLNSKPTVEAKDKSTQHIKYIQLDLSDDKSIEHAINSIFQKGHRVPDIVIHCAACSNVGFCQKNEAKAMKINCPTKLVDALLANYKSIKMRKHPLFIFFSTDHVYDGELSHTNNITHASMHGNNAEMKQTENKENKKEDKHKMKLYDEQSVCSPTNHYGQSKLMMEKYLLLHWSNLVILRCSVIYGGNNPIKSTLLQFVKTQLSDDKNKQVILFKNEKRNFVCISSVVKAVQYFVEKYADDTTEYHDVYNCGGVDSYSRVEFGQIVGKIYALDTTKINAMNRYDCTEKWAHVAPNPQDVSMSSRKLYQELQDFHKFASLEQHVNEIKSNE